MKHGNQLRNWLAERLPETERNRNLRQLNQRKEELTDIHQQASGRYLGNRTPTLIQGGEDNFALTRPVYGHTTFRGLSIGGELLGEEAEVSDVYFSFCTFQNCKLDNIRFVNCTFVGALFEGTEFGRVTFQNCTFNEGSDPDLEWEEGDVTCFFENCLFQGSYQGKWVLFDGCDLRWTLFAGCATKHIVLKYCDLSETMIDGGQLQGLWFQGCNLKGQRICRTERLDIYFDEGEHCQVDERFYVDYMIGSRAFSHEMEKSLRRVAHICKIHDLDDISAEYIYRARCTQETFLHGYRRLSALCQHMVCGYGERPAYTLYIILLHNFLFALLYMFSGIFTETGVINYNLLSAHLSTGSVVVDYLKCLFFSITTFTTVGYGNYLPLGTLSMVLTSVQMILGLCLSALWTGCILRKISR